MSEPSNPRALIGAYVVEGPTLFLAPPDEPIRFETVELLCARIKLDAGNHVVGCSAMFGSFRGSATFPGFYVFSHDADRVYQSAVHVGIEKPAFEAKLIAAGCRLGDAR